MNIISRSKEDNFCLFKNIWNSIDKFVTENPKASKIWDESIIALNKHLKTLTIILEDSLDLKDISNDPFFDFFLTHDSLHKFFMWSINSGPHFELLKISQLQIYQVLLANYHQKILIHKPVLRPLLKLIKCCSKFGGTVSYDVQRRLVFVLNEISGIFHREKGLFDFYLTVTCDSYKFLFVSTLVSFIQREDEIGQLSKNSLLFYTSLSSIHDDLAKFIEEKSNFSAVSAATLGCLYSNLPRRLLWPADHPHRISKEAIVNITGLLDIINFLQFLDVVIQKIHPRIREQLVAMVYGGFLNPVLGQCLRQELDTGLDEVITSTAYFEALLRHVRHPAMVKVFVDFLFRSRDPSSQSLESPSVEIHNSHSSLLELIVARLAKHPDERMKLVNLSLLYTLLEMNCEDLMLELVFKYLIPCQHVMTSQIPRMASFDTYGRPAHKFLALIPSFDRMTTSRREKADDTPYLGDVWEGTDESSGLDPERDVLSTDPPSSYLTSYVLDARRSIFLCRRACRSIQQRQTVTVDSEIPPLKLKRTKARWLRAYDGPPHVNQTPPPTNHRHSRQNRPTDYASLTSESSSSSSASSTTTTSGLTPNFPAKSGEEPALARAKSGSLDSDPLLDSGSVGEVINISPPRQKTTSNLASTESLDHHLSTDDDSSRSSQGPVVGSEFDVETFFDFLDRLDSTLAPTRTKSSSSERALIADQLIEGWSSEGRKMENQDASVENEKVRENVCPKLNGSFPSPPQTLSGTRGHPYIGPFLTTLFDLTERMDGNSLFLNLHLTGCISRLCCYPQPILQALLLNCTLTTQPGIKSLIQVLGIVKSKLEEYASTQMTLELNAVIVRDHSHYESERIFGALKARAKRYLSLRERVFREKLAIHRWGRTEHNNKVPANAQDFNSPENLSTHLISSVPEYRSPFETCTPSHQSVEVVEAGSNPKGEKQRLHVLSNWTGYKFINKKNIRPNPAETGAVNENGSILPGIKSKPDESSVVLPFTNKNRQLDIVVSEGTKENFPSFRTKNVVYCAVIFEEFLKELASLSYEMALSSC